MSDPQSGHAMSPPPAPASVARVGEDAVDERDQATPAGPGAADVAADGAADDIAGARRPSHWLSFLAVAALVVGVDQVSKRFIDRNLAVGESWPSADWPIRILHVKNTGAAFSLLENQTLFLTVMSVVGLGAIILYFRYRPSDHPLLRWALALQLGGAIGNLIDRVRYGEVTDFFKFPRFAVFNVADSAITIGVTIVVLFLLFGGGERERPAMPER